MVTESTLFSLEQKGLLYKSKFSLGKSHVVEEWRAVGRGVGCEAHELSSLSPDFETRIGPDYEFRQHLSRGLVLLGGAVCVYFSVLRVWVPLLAPYLAILGIVFVAAGLQAIRAKTWTLVRTKHGQIALSIVHNWCKKDERETFEARLSEAILRSRAEEEASREHLASGPGTSPDVAPS